MRFAPLLLALLTACAEPPSPSLSPTDAAGQDSVLAVLRTLDGDALGAAFARLEQSTPYVVETRIEQLGADGMPVASQSRTLRVGASDAEIVAADSAGTFDYGAFGALSGSTVWEAGGGGVNPVSLMLPEDPAWLDPRGREIFQFGTAPDTLLADRRVRALTVVARPGEGDDQPLRHARLYLDAETHTLVGFRLHRRMDSVLFGERTDALVLLHPDSGGWRPHQARFVTTLAAPLTPPRRFRLTRRYVYSNNT